LRRNVELKASDPDPGRSLELCLGLGATDHGWLHQIDTYFQVSAGRLKLREQDDTAQLIHYERADEATARESRYRIVEIEDPVGLKDALARALTVKVIVSKARHLLLWRNVRIHLDEVKELGNFIELEAVAAAGSDLTNEQDNLSVLLSALAISPEQIVAVGYSDQLLSLT
jgi:adenylate cyclase class IV